MSACNYKSTVPMSFICKQIWLPPLLLAVKGSICVIATLEKMNELCEIFSKLLRGFVCHRDHSIDQDVSNLAWLSRHSCTPESQQHPAPGREGSTQAGLCCPIPYVDDSYGCGTLAGLQPVVLEGGWQGGFAVCGYKVQLSLYSCVQARSVLPL